MIIMVTILMRCRCKFYKVFKIRSMCPTYIWSADRSSLTIIIFFRHGLIKNIVLKFCEIKFSMNNSDLMKTRQWYHFNDFVHKAFYRHTTHQWFSKKKNNPPGNPNQLRGFKAFTSKTLHIVPNKANTICAFW